METTEGTLTVKDGKSVEQVVIKKGTPGVIEKIVDGNTVMVSFEEGVEGGVVFGDSQDRKGPYYMRTASWKNGKRKLNYGGKMYSTSSASSNIYLEFKMKRLRSFKKEERVVKGRKL